MESDKQFKRTLKRGMLRISHIKNTYLDQRQKIVILLYHRVLPAIHFNPLNTIIHRSIFLNQIESIARYYPVLSLQDILDGKHRKNKISIILTFDDGYIDNYEIVFPELIKKGIPATFFIMPSYVGQKNGLWDWEIFSYLNDTQDVNVIDVGDQKVIRCPKESSLDFSWRLFNILRQLNHEARMNILNKLNRSLTLENSFMNWEQLSKMSEAGMEIGSHSLTHSSLAHVSSLEAEQEIFQSKYIIESKLGKPCSFFSIPFGSQSDFNSQVLRAVQDAGYSLCLSNIQGYNSVPWDGTCLKRVVMDENRSVGSLLA